MERDMLEGQRVVVFGGLSGIGLSTARLALAYGAVVTVASRTRARLEAAKVKLGDVEIAALDPCDPTPRSEA
jgi:NAD(P)-dependent dehydrogenase (short-subunit alcohol dehydrogenase family)